MTKRNYVAMAKVFQDSYREAWDSGNLLVISGVSIALEKFIVYAAEDNPKFNEETFRKAVGPWPQS